MLPPLEEVQRRRKVLGLTQSELARASGVSQSLIAKLELGLIDPSYTKVKSIFDALERMESRIEIHASQIATKDVVGIDRNERLAEAAKLMSLHGFSQLVVLDGDRVVGSISEKGLLGQILAGKDTSRVSNMLVEEVMEEAFPQVGEDAPVSLISSMLRVYSAVLVSAKGKTTGIITKADLLKILSQNEGSLTRVGS